MEELALHPTVKPVALVADALKDCSKRNGLALDPFCGSGTVLIAAERTGRRARAIEIDPLYVDTAVRRWERYTGRSATLASTGEAFDEVERRVTRCQSSMTGHLELASGDAAESAATRQAIEGTTEVSSTEGTI
jgi:hypothetical protein